MILNGKSFQGYHIKAGVRQGSVLGPTLFLQYIVDFIDVICNIDDTTLYSKCAQAFDYVATTKVGL